MLNLVFIAVHSGEPLWPMGLWFYFMPSQLYVSLFHLVSILVQDVEFDCIGSWLLPFRLLMVCWLSVTWINITFLYEPFFGWSLADFWLIPYMHKRLSGGRPCLYRHLLSDWWSLHVLEIIIGRWLCMQKRLRWLCSLFAICLYHAFSADDFKDSGWCD